MGFTSKVVRGFSTFAPWYHVLRYGVRSGVRVSGQAVGLVELKARSTNVKRYMM